MQQQVRDQQVHQARVMLTHQQQKAVLVIPNHQVLARILQLVVPLPKKAAVAEE